jgi:hypothetical protein
MSFGSARERRAYSRHCGHILFVHHFEVTSLVVCLLVEILLVDIAHTPHRFRYTHTLRQLPVVWGNSFGVIGLRAGSAAFLPNVLL